MSFEFFLREHLIIDRCFIKSLSDVQLGQFVSRSEITPGVHRFRGKVSAKAPLYFALSVTVLPRGLHFLCFRSEINSPSHTQLQKAVIFDWIGKSPEQMNVFCLSGTHGCWAVAETLNTAVVGSCRQCGLEDPSGIFPLSPCLSPFSSCC